MKRIITFLFLLWAAGLSAQLISWNSQPQFTNRLDFLASGSNGQWVIGGQQYLPSKFTATVAVLQPDGAQLWKHDFQQAPETVLQDLLALPGGQVAVAGGASNCDAIYPGWLTLLDEKGNEAWTVQPAGWFVDALALAPGGDIFAASTNVIEKYDHVTGAVLATYPFKAANNIHDFYYLPDLDLFVLGGSAGVTFLSPSNNSEQTVPSLSPNVTIERVLPWANGKTLGLTNTGITEEFTPAGSVQHPFPYTVYDMDVYDKGLALCGRDAARSALHFIDHDFVELGSIPVSNPDLFALKVGVDGAGFVLAGVEMNGPAPRQPNVRGSDNFNNNQHFWVQQYYDDIVPVPGTEDAALTELIVDTPPKAQITDPSSPAPWRVSGGTFSVRLVNNGSTPLQSVTLNASDYGLAGPPYSCSGKSVVFQEFTGLNLAPGQETVLSLGEIASDYVSSIHPWKICVWTSRPNGRPDNFHENDYTCRTFDLTTSNREIALHEITLYPNPASDAVYLVSLYGQPGLCRLQNVAGQTLSEQIPQNDNGRFNIEVGNLPAGVYFLQTDIGWGRFVKQ